ncbi:MAG TPA: inositol 2-dehydrogenase [Bdellovibrionales bacterium]|nr:inositol 2-dehydrogenase [Bdellovibrionales bacterium]
MSNMLNQKLKLGVIGAGRIGRVHAETIQYRIPNAEITMISDVNLEAARKAAADFQIPFVTEDYRDILTNAEIQGVVICSSTDTHARIIMEAAAAGKHIFCEKPVDLSIPKINEALASVKKAGVKFQVGFNRRYDPNFKRIADAVRAGELGQPHLVRITSRDPNPPPISYVKVSGGLFLDMTIHDFDMARYVINDEVEEVYAIGQNLIDPEIKNAGDVDTAVVTLKYKGGAICTIDNSRKAVYGYDQRLEVFGSKGCMLASNNTPTNTQHWDAQAQKRDLPLNFFLERYTDSYIGEMKEFVSCVLNNQQPTCSGIDGLRSVVLGMAAMKSMAEGRPVKISEIATGSNATNEAMNIRWSGPEANA